jgi:signal transduction histidine kinase
MDIRLKGEMDGIATAEKIRTLFNIPVIYLTAYSDDDTLQRAKITEAYSYILKPFQVRELQINIEIALHRHNMERKLKESEEELRNSKRRLEEAFAELKATQKQIIQQERLRALGQMASGIAHDFNNALTPILGYSELMLMVEETLSDKEEMKRYLKLMNTAAKDAKDIVSRLSQFYRKREEDEIFVPVNLNRLVEQTIELTKPKWRDQALARGITISIKTELQKVSTISGNEANLREVLTNLIFNAVDAMKENGAITIRTYPESEEVVLEISDTGMGMTEEVKWRCFEPFFSTKEELGTGLGLAVVYGIINRHEGRIEILSEVSKGTTVIVRLPSYIKQQTETKWHKEANLRPLHVLLVDDEPLVCDVITKYLTTDGHIVQIATNGIEGLEKFYKGRFDLVITDQAMPDMNGEKLVGFIKQVAPKAPVIMLTGFGDIMKAAGEIPSGVSCLLSKPVTLPAFREALYKVKADSNTFP